MNGCPTGVHGGEILVAVRFDIGVSLFCGVSSCGIVDGVGKYQRRLPAIIRPFKKLNDDSACRFLLFAGLLAFRIRSPSLVAFVEVDTLSLIARCGWVCRSFKMMKTHFVAAKAVLWSPKGFCMARVVCGLYCFSVARNVTSITDIASLSVSPK